MDLAESPERCLFDGRNCTSEAHSQMLDDGPTCDLPWILGIDGPVTVVASRPKRPVAMVSVMRSGPDMIYWNNNNEFLLSSIYMRVIENLVQSERS